MKIPVGVRHPLPRGLGGLKTLRTPLIGVAPVWFTPVLFVLGADGQVAEILEPGAPGSKDRLVLADGDQWMLDIGATSAIGVVAGFVGGTMEQVERTFCQLRDGDNALLAEAELPGLSGYCAGLLVRIYRRRGQWWFHTLGCPSHAQTPVELLRDLHALV